MKKSRIVNKDAFNFLGTVPLIKLLLRLRELAAELGLTREELPGGTSYGGCIRELRISEGGASRYVSLGTPSDGENYQVCLAPSLPFSTPYL